MLDFWHSEHHVTDAHKKLIYVKKLRNKVNKRISGFDINRWILLKFTLRLCIFEWLHSNTDGLFCTSEEKLDQLLFNLDYKAIKMFDDISG